MLLYRWVTSDRSLKYGCCVAMLKFIICITANKSDLFDLQSDWDARKSIDFCESGMLPVSFWARSLANKGFRARSWTCDFGHEIILAIAFVPDYTFTI